MAPMDNCTVYRLHNLMPSFRKSTDKVNFDDGVASEVFLDGVYVILIAGK